MRKKLLLTPLLVVVLTATASAMATTATRAPRAIRPDGITVSGVKLTATPQGPHLVMKVAVSADAVSSLQSVSVVPTLSAGTRGSANFPHVLINGKNRSRIWERHEKFGYTEIVENPPHSVVTVDSRFRGGSVDYVASLDSEDWMSGATLGISLVVISPGGERQSYDLPIAAESIVTAPVTYVEAAPVQAPPTGITYSPPVVQTPPPYQAPPVVQTPPPTGITYSPPVTQTPPPVQTATAYQTAPAYQAPPVVQTPPPYQTPPVVQTPPPYQAPSVVRTPPPTAGSVYTFSGTANLYFATSSSYLEPTIGHNVRELAAIDEPLTQIAAHPATTLVSLTITGYSSPEGLYDRNMSLARDRAQTLSLYLEQRHSISPALIRVRAVGEDWSGLRAAVVGSREPWPYEVLEIIDSAEGPDAKESRLRRLSGGRIWQRMEQEIFPALQKVDYSIDYLTAQ
jgi:outer membrane protein OmpA-like peptidoglycan-associated protein